MSTTRAVATTFCLLLATSAFAQWQPAKGPLMTRWAKDVSPENVLAEYPRPQLERAEWVNLNGVWEWKEGPADAMPTLGEALPGRILVPFPFESALSGVMKNVRSAWYRRSFEVPAAWKGRRVILNFGAVDWSCAVYVNGKKAGEHSGGYDPFSFDITEQVGEGAVHELWVYFSDPTDEGTQPRGKQVLKPEGIWYTPCSGIWQTVWLEGVNPLYLKSMRITPDLKAGVVRFRPVVDSTNPRMRVNTAIRIGDRLITRALLPLNVESEVSIPEIRPWTPEDPFLYTLEFDVSRAEGKGEVSFDKSKGYFGLRDISIGQDERGVTRIMLNGHPYFHAGPLDQGFWPDGIYTAPTDEALRYDLEMTKKLGFNAVRKHVKVEPQRWYYWADKLGLLVWKDMPSGDKYIGPKDPDITRTPESVAAFEAELKAIMLDFHNHPSIVMWVPFNEGWGQFDTARITDYVRKLDPSRLVNSASGWSDRGTGDVHDVHVYPGPGSPEPESARAAVLGEFGGLGLRSEGHSWTDKNWGYRGARDSQDLTDQYVALMRGVYALADSPGLSAAIYTQTTDVETECNGLLTYDREVLKVDGQAVRDANRGIFPRVRNIDPPDNSTAEWQYTTSAPPEGWEKPGADSGGWKTGAGGFGSKGTPGAEIGTEWTSPEIWIRREFSVGNAEARRLRLLVHHDEDCRIFINGVPALELKGYTSGYGASRMSAEAAASLKPTGNTIAVHCRQTSGGQFIDVKFIEEIPVR